jgi:transcriptional regulator with XRE-family HTH domain
VDAYNNVDYLALLGRVAKNVRALRQSRGISQERAAWDCGLSWSVYQRVESGKGNLTLITLAKIAAGLRVDPQCLFEESLENNG